MKALRPLLPALIILSCSTLAFAHTPAQPSAQTPAQKSFDLMKSLAGTWEGTITTSPAAPEEGKRIHVRLRVTSSGNALMHEMNMPGAPDGPITMVYLNGSHLYLRHYCVVGNRPRMVAKLSGDGKTINFNLVDVSGSTRHGYMEHAKFTLIGANHHTEDWTFLEPGNHPGRAHFDLHRVDGTTAAR